MAEETKTQSGYPPEVAQSLQLKAMQCIAVAREEGRLSWDGKIIQYRTRGNKKYEKNIDGMPVFFLEITGTDFWIAMFGPEFMVNFLADVKEVFVKVLNSSKGEIDTEKLEAEITAKMDILRAKAQEENKES